MSGTSMLIDKMNVFMSSCLLPEGREVGGNHLIDNDVPNQLGH